MERHITLPLTEDLARSLKAGDSVYLTGEIYTSRDAGHKRMCANLPGYRNGMCVFRNWSGCTYCGRKFE